MKEIRAVLRPHLLDAVVDAIEALPDAPGLTVTQVQGFGHRRGSGPAQLVDRVQIQLVVADEIVDAVLGAITRTARTGRTGDGKVFVTDVSDAIRIRTGERGPVALRPSTVAPEPE